MTLKVLIDMNLSVEWVPFLQQNGFTAVHRSLVGDPRAVDPSIMSWAVGHGHLVFTHDLDFGTTLALSRATGPSVIQVRSRRILPEHVGDTVVNALRKYANELSAGALVVVDEVKCRVRVLPF